MIEFTFGKWAETLTKNSLTASATWSGEPLHSRLARGSESCIFKNAFCFSPPLMRIRCMQLFDFSRKVIFPKFGCHSKVTRIKQQNYFHHLKRPEYNIELLLYPRPFRWWKYFCCFICVTLLWTLHTVINQQFFYIYICSFFTKFNLHI